MGIGDDFGEVWLVLPLLEGYHNLLETSPSDRVNSCLQIDDTDSGMPITYIKKHDRL